ncbi:hypothetical protein [Salipiger sp. PrR003]|uniref:hypothetical protein n=1 Tax=Salipiger sp. PrR003 TaxID=2706776 RepID=UPI0013DA9C4B|nr:hypothetical protein [Salipiger sp. PrR003]NDV53333.1 hypothetical protein [Salipiger sp. PrR003]
MSQDRKLETSFDGHEVAGLLHALSHYETYWSALVLSADHMKGKGVSQELVTAWREARMLRRRIEHEAEQHQFAEMDVGPASMDVY